MKFREKYMMYSALSDALDQCEISTDWGSPQYREGRKDASAVIKRRIEKLMKKVVSIETEDEPEYHK